MKKTLAAVAVLGAFAGSALAADVTLYGKVDLGLQYTHTEIDFHKSGLDTLKSDNYEMKSGGNSTSRIGLKGVEDISEGVKVGFQLEQGIKADKNASTLLRTMVRCTWVALVAWMQALALLMAWVTWLLRARATATSLILAPSSM